MTSYEESIDIPALAVISNLEIAPPILVLLSYVAHVILLLAVAYSMLDYDWWVKWCTHCFRAGGKQKRIEVRIEVSVQAVATLHNVQHSIDDMRADKQPSNTLDRIKLAKHQSYCVKSFDDGSSYNEGAFTSGYCTASSNYSDFSYRSRIVGGGNVKITRSMLQGTESEADKAHHIHRHTTKVSQEVSPQDDYLDNSFRAVHNSVAGSTALSRVKCEDSYASKQNWEGSSLEKQVQKESSVYTQDEASRRQIKNEPVKILQETTLPSGLPESKLKSNTGHGYNKATYAVLVGNVVKVYNTNTFASLPHNNKFMVKERHQDAFGVTRVKLALKQSR